MGYKLKHIHAFKRVCRDLWKYSKEQREAGSGVLIRDVAGSGTGIGRVGLCYAIKQHRIKTGEGLIGHQLALLPHDLYTAYHEKGGYLPGEGGVWTPERVALLKFYCTTPAKELLKALEGAVVLTHAIRE